MILSWPRVEPNVCSELMADLGEKTIPHSFRENLAFQVGLCFGFSCDSHTGKSGSRQSESKWIEMLSRKAGTESDFQPGPVQIGSAIAETVETYCETGLPDQTKVTRPTPPPTCWRSFRWWCRTRHLGSNLWCTQNNLHSAWPTGQSPWGESRERTQSRVGPGLVHQSHCQCGRSKVQESLGVRLHRWQKGNRKEGLSCDKLRLGPLGSWLTATVGENQHDNHDTPFTNWPIWIRFFLGTTGAPLPIPDPFCLVLSVVVFN